MKYLIYTRVSPKGSTWSGTETTVADQAAQCQAYVFATDSAGIVVDTITDEFESGGSSKRPGWMRILNEAKSGVAEWDVLVVRHLDRFSRSISDAVNALEILHKNGKCLIATAQGLNSSTPSGRGVINILLSIAQMEREFTSERTILKMRSIASKGLWPVGRAPYGYKRGKAHDNKLQTDPVKAEHVRQIFQRYRSGAGSMELARDYGIPKNQVLHILRNRAYLGLLHYNDEEFEGQHEAIITPEIYNEVQTMLPGSRHAARVKSQTYPYLFTGLVRCACGYHMTPASAHGRSEKYHYYQCTDNKTCRKRVRAESLEEIVLTTLKEIAITEEAIEKIMEHIRLAVTQTTKPDAQLKDLEKKAELARARREKLVNMFAEGIVNKSNADLINNQLTAASEEYNTLIGKIGAIKSVSGPSSAAMEDIMRFARSVEGLGQHLKNTSDPADLRTICSIWIKEIRRTGEIWEITLNLPGSPNCQCWLRKLIQGEPLRMSFSHNVSVLGLLA